MTTPALTGATEAAATPTLGAGETAFQGAAQSAGTEATPSWMNQLSQAWDKYAPSKSTVQTVSNIGTIGNLGKQLLTPSKSAAPPSAPAISSGRTGSYTPTTTAPMQTLANLIAQRRQATASRRFTG